MQFHFFFFLVLHLKRLVYFWVSEHFIKLLCPNRVQRCVFPREFLPDVVLQPVLLKCEIENLAVVLTAKRNIIIVDWEDLIKLSVTSLYEIWVGKDTNPGFVLCYV